MPMPFQMQESLEMKNVLSSAIDDFYSALGLIRLVVYGPIGPSTTKEIQVQRIEQANAFYMSFKSKLGKYISLSNTLAQTHEKAVMEYCNNK